MIIGQPDATISISLVGATESEASFVATYHEPNFTGAVEFSDYMTGGPVALFEDMARNWRGWDGERDWADLEGYLELSATSENTGHVAIRVTMTNWSSAARLRGKVVVEAGQLDRIAKEMRDLFPLYERKY